MLSKLTSLNGLPHFGNFTIMAFDSNEEFDSYVEADHYGFNDNHPAVCFGFQIHENSETDYELELMFNDLFPR